MMKRYVILLVVTMAMIMSCKINQTEKPGTPGFRLTKSDTIHFNSFVDCNMAEAWIGDTFRIFPGKYGEDPLWDPNGGALLSLPNLRMNFLDAKTRTCSLADRTYSVSAIHAKTLTNS